MSNKLAHLVLKSLLEPTSDDDEDAMSAAAAAEISSERAQRIAALEEENRQLEKEVSVLSSELQESKRNNETLLHKLKNLNDFVKRLGGSSDYVLKGSTSYFRKENQQLKTRLSSTAKNVAEIKRRNEDLVRAHELDRRAIEELSSTISDLEFRIRVGIVSDEFTDEYCKVAHGIEPENCTTDSPATNKPNNVITENCTTDSPATNKPNNRCKGCELMRVQLSKNSISIHCLIGRLKQMEQDLFDLRSKNNAKDKEIVALKEEMDLRS